MNGRIDAIQVVLVAGVVLFEVHLCNCVVIEFHVSNRLQSKFLKIPMLP